jgi:hypothetical protein
MFVSFLSLDSVSHKTSIIKAKMIVNKKATDSFLTIIGKAGNDGFERKGAE